MKEELKEKITKRKESNLEILDILYDYFNNHSDIRFWQGLYNRGIIKSERIHRKDAFGKNMDSNPIIVDDYNKESVDILEKLKQCQQ